MVVVSRWLTSRRLTSILAVASMLQVAQMCSTRRGRTVCGIHRTEGVQLTTEGRDAPQAGPFELCLGISGDVCYARTRCSSRHEVSLSGVGSGLSALATCDADMW